VTHLRTFAAAQAAVEAGVDGVFGHDHVWRSASRTPGRPAPGP